MANVAWHQLPDSWSPIPYCGVRYRTSLWTLRRSFFYFLLGWSPDYLREQSKFSNMLLMWNSQHLGALCKAFSFSVYILFGQIICSYGINFHCFAEGTRPDVPIKAQVSLSQYTFGSLMTSWKPGCQVISCYCDKTESLAQLKMQVWAGKRRSWPDPLVWSVY